MLDIDKIAFEVIEEKIKIPISEVNTKDQTMFVSNAIMATVKALSILQKEYEKILRWIPVEEKEPESFKNDEDGIYYSKYLELKVVGYDYPLIGYYVSANDDQFFDIISEKDDEIKQEDITHFRECFL